MFDFSVIIPSYGRAESLARCLESLRLQDFSPGRFEVIIVDDGSDLPPHDVVQRSSLQNARLLCEPHRGPAGARNAGAAAAAGTFLAFTDDDCRPAPNWLSAISNVFAQDPNAVIGGKTINALNGNVYSAASQLLIDYLYSYYNAQNDFARMLTSNNFALPAATFKSIGGFDHSFPSAAAEDRELCDRLLHHGYRMQYVPGAVVYHNHDLTMARFWKQHFHYGSGAFRYHQLRAQRTQNGIRVEPASYYWRLLCYPMHVRASRSYQLTALMAISQVANAAGFFHQKYSQRTNGKPATA